MSYDIYGNNLRPGHCEVHPHIHEEYPCSICLSENDRKGNEYRLKSFQRQVSQLQSENAQLKQENERLKAQNIDLAFKVANVKSNVAHYFGDACQHEYVRIESTVPYMQCRKCFHRYDAENVLNQPSKERKPTKL